MSTVVSGGFKKDAQLERNLYQYAMAYPSIADKIVHTEPQYSTTYITHALTSVKPIKLGSNSHLWPLKGRYQNPLTATGTATGTGSGNVPFYVEMTTNDAGIFDVVKFASGVQASLIDGGTPSAGGYTYKMVIDGPSTDAIVTSDYASGQGIGRGWNTSKEDSSVANGGTKYPDWLKNWSSISRRESSVTGSWASQKTWIKAGGDPHGFYTYVKHEEDRKNFMWEREKKLTFSRNNFDSNGNCLTFDANGDPLPQGDGKLAQISGYNVDTYSNQLQATQLLEYIAGFIQLAGLMEGAEVMVECGMQGKLMWYNCMENKYFAQHVLRQDMKGGTAVILGNVYDSFFAFGVWFHLHWSPIKDDIQFNVNIASNGFAKEALNFDFYAITQADGTPNMERYVRDAGDLSRELIIKELSGMMSTEYAVGSSRDAKVIEFLSDEFIVIPDPTRCGRLLQA